MFSLYSYFADHILAVLIIFVLLFLLLLYIFAKDKLGEAVIGLLKSLASLLYSPFIHIKNIVQGLVTNYEEGDKNIVQTKQYLLNKLILLFEALLVIISTAILAITLIQAWNAMMPHESITNTIDNIKADIASNEEAYEKMNDEMKKLDDEWNEKSQGWIKEFKDAQQKTLTNKRKENENLASALETNQNVNYYYEYLQSYLSSESQSFNPNYIESYKNNARSYFSYSNIDDYYKTELEKFLGNWIEIMTAKYNLDNFSDQLMRNKKQPNYNDLASNLSTYEQNLANLRTNLAEYEKLASYKVGAFFIQILIGLLTYIIFIWVFGVAIELLNLSVNLASNVNGIKKKLYETKN